jgi:hypothetical protein
MLLRNWYNIIKAAAYGDGKSGLQCVNTSNKTFALYGYSEYLPTAAIPQAKINFWIDSYSTSSAYIHLGRGTTPPTLDDYCLEDLISSGVSLGDKTVVKSIDGNTVTLEYGVTVNNASSDDITIGEVGISVPASYASNSRYAVLIERTVLSEPVTIKAGEVGSVTYTLVWKLPSPPA